MVGKKNKGIGDLFRSNLNQILNQNHSLIILSKEIDWSWIEKEMNGYYSDIGRPSVPIRTMVGLLLLKQLYNQSDESVIDRWVENPYWQYFTGEQYFQHRPPFNPTDFVHFRKRVGEQGMEKILALTVKVHDGAKGEEEVQIDTTVQEKNITFPTDMKLQRRVMQYLRLIAQWEEISLRQSYIRVEKKLIRQTHNGNHPRNKKRASKARKTFKTIAGRLLRDVSRKLSKKQLEHYRCYLALYEEVIHQKRSDKNKIYSLHEPQVQCISKGKAHKKYEFGNKVSIVRGSESGVVLAVKSFATNIYDGHALEESINQCTRIMQMIEGEQPKRAVVDRGCRGRKEINGTAILIPSVPKATDTAYQKRKKRKKFRARAAIEPVIGHLKYDHRMLRNYLSGTLGDIINAMAAGCAFNLKKRLNQIKIEVKSSFWLIFNLWPNKCTNQQLHSLVFLKRF
jgi:IS5 family transposase